MMRNIAASLMAVGVSIFSLLAHGAPMNVLMDFEGFATGQPLPPNAYPPFSWTNELVFDTLGTVLEPPFAGTNVLARGTCPAGSACDVQLTVGAGHFIQQFTISGFTAGGPDLFVLAQDANGNVIADTLGNVNLVVDTEQQSVGCAVATSWSCDRTFAFAAGTSVRSLVIVTGDTGVIDNLRIQTSDVLPPPGVPEPSSLALTVAALLSAIAFRRRAYVGNT